MNTETDIRYKKVPEVNGLFWGIKILTTAMGEIISDFLVTQYDPVIAVIFATIIFLVIFFIQFYSKKYSPWKYWLTVAMVAIVGTMAADVAHIVLGIPYVVSTIVFGAILAGIFIMWHRTEHSLSIHSVRTKRRELFYWATIIATFALGTATGDMTASTLHLGYLSSGILFAVIIAIPAIVYLRTKRHEVLWFWLAYILTRPLGASFADWFGKSSSIGGLGFGDAPVSIVLLVGFIALVSYVSVQHKRDALHGDD